MTKFILNAKHWQLFILTFGLPFVGMIFYVVGLITSINFNVETQDVSPFQISASAIVLFVFAAMFLITSAFFHIFWLWTVGTKLEEHYSENTKRLNVKRFKVFFLFPFFYMLILPLLILGITSSIGTNGQIANPGVFALCIMILILCHFFTLFCGIHTMYFCSKKLKIVIEKRNVQFLDYIGEFFLIWFFPIGIWFIQPKINQLVGKKVSEEKLLDDYSE